MSGIASWVLNRHVAILTWIAEQSDGGNNLDAPGDIRSEGNDDD